MQRAETPKLLADKEKVNLRILTFPALLFLISLIISLMILPENCSLLENDPEGFWMCHTVPSDCCPDTGRRLLARSVAFAGLGLALAPFIFAFLNSRKSKDKLKIFD